jgi:hypothetical protein
MEIGQLAGGWPTADVGSNEQQNVLFPTAILPTDYRWSMSGV